MPKDNRPIITLACTTYVGVERNAASGMAGATERWLQRFVTKLDTAAMKP